MINQTLIWLLALPIVIGIILYILRRDTQDAWKAAGAYSVVGVVIVASAFAISKGSKTGDIELWNGQVVSKERKHDTYEQSYTCNCVTDPKGNTTCQTCYETHYTVEWKCDTTVGEFQIQKEDKTNKRVYRLPDPPRYTIIKPGDPVARRMPYTNYVQAVPNSLFTPAAADLKKKFRGLIPPYPDRVYDFYKVDRFITPGWSPVDEALWNQDISNALREVGPRKQVNAIIVVAKTDDPNYEYALTDAWEGVNKNDVVLLIGSTQYPKIDFVRVISWTKNESFKVQLRDAVQERGTIDRSIIHLMTDHIAKNFERRKMSEFSYLEGEIDPPEWLVISLILVLLIGAGIIWYNIPKWFGGRRRYR